MTLDKKTDWDSVEITIDFLEGILKSVDAGDPVAAREYFTDLFQFVEYGDVVYDPRSRGFVDYCGTGFLTMMLIGGFLKGRFTESEKQDLYWDSLNCLNVIKKCFADAKAKGYVKPYEED